ncbi:MAG: hypothetical protein IPO28_03015 [Holophagaceae bacterium]|nr:hypothetical protein [Holophagaceae bacterium]
MAPFSLRRDFLAGTAETRFPFTGEPDLPLGHWLRGGFPSRIGSSRSSPSGVAACGLSAAWRLAGAGVDDFRVLELEPEPGAPRDPAATT